VKKPTLSDALATKAPPLMPEVPSVEPAPARRQETKDARITTTVRLSPEMLEALKIVAARKRVRVNDLLLEGAAHVLAINGHKLASIE
jgi:hypothetical protein